MANRPYLLNTSFLTSDPHLVEARRRKDGLDYVQVDGPGYRLPIPWLCCFRQEDLKPVEVRLEDGAKKRLRLPSTTVKQAIANLERALPLFARVTGEARLSRRYWEEALAWLRVLPLPYLALNHLELLAMVPDEGDAQLMRALARNASVLPEMKAFSVYRDGALPYAPDVLKSVPGVYFDKRRMDNAVALDACARGEWRRANGIADEPALTVPPPRGRHDLGTVHEHVVTMIRGRDRDAAATYGFMPFAAPGRHRLKMLLSAGSDRRRDKLLADRELRAALDGFIKDKLRALCLIHGFEWAGFVIESRPNLSRQFRNTDDWVKLAAIA